MTSKCSSSLGPSWASNQVPLGLQVGARARLTEIICLSLSVSKSVHFHLFPSNKFFVVVKNVLTMKNKKCVKSRKMVFYGIVKFFAADFVAKHMCYSCNLKRFHNMILPR